MSCNAPVVLHCFVSAFHNELHLQMAHRVLQRDFGVRVIREVQ